MSIATATFAFDRKSARSFDADGRMRVRDCIVSVAEVNPYWGREIPGASGLALDANTVYDLYRHPDELSAAVDSFNGLPLMIKHVAQTADEPRKEYIGGSVYNARFDGSKLRADLLVQDAKAIEYIQSGELADLSSSYRYTPDMTPGDWNGRAYHGVMRNIEGNHVALVEDGRASGAHVADRALSQAIPTGEHTVADIDPNAAPAAPAAGNAEVAQALIMLTEKLASIESRLTAVESPGASTGAANALTANDSDKSDDDDDKDDKKAEDSDKSDDKKAEDSDKDDAGKKAEDKVAMDAAIEAAIAGERARAREVRDAAAATRHLIGDTHAMDDAGEIYREALKAAGMDVTKVPKGNERAVYAGYMAGSQGARPVHHAHDSSNSGDGTVVPFDLSRIAIKG